MDNILTRKIGPLPGWAWGGLAVGGALVVFAVIGRKSSTSTTGTSTTGTSTSGSLTNNPAASSIPYVPSVTVESTTPGATSSTTTGYGTITLGPASGQPNSGVWSTSVAAYPQPSNSGPYTLVPFGSYPSAGPPVNGMYPFTFEGGTLYALGENVMAATDSGTAGSGGRGSFGTVSITPYMGWTSGPTPVGGSGGPPPVRKGKGCGKGCATCG